MEGPDNKSAKGMAGWLFWLGFIGLLIWQGWLALGLFGDQPWEALLDERPIVSGKHPQHLYLATVGALALHSTGGICVYDPAFQAVYLKTPIFNGSRLGEVFLFLARGTCEAAAYKIGLVVICLLVPTLLVVAGLGMGLHKPAILGAAAVGLLLWWSPDGRETLEAGDSALLLASLALVAHFGLLIRFDRFPGFLVWQGMVVTACLGWFAQPLLFPIALPLLLVYYLNTGARHASLTWHLSLLGAEVLALAINLPWLMDWVGFWWLRSDIPVSDALLPHRTLGTLWNAPLWGGPADRALAMVLLGSALVGVWIMNQTRQRAAARLFTMGAAGLMVLALLGISWEPLGDMGTSALLLPALWFAALPAAHAWHQSIVFLIHVAMVGRVSRPGHTGGTALESRPTLEGRPLVGQAASLFRVGGLILLAAGLVALVAFCHEDLLFLARRTYHTEPLLIGLGPDREAVVETITSHTGPEARILWEDRPVSRKTPRWSALLPILTGRAYMGGLDPDGTIEPSALSFLDQALEGRPIGTWSDEALDEYCKRYNIGWVVAWSPAVVKRFSAWDGAAQLAPLVDEVPGSLFAVKNSPRNFALKGQAQLVHADGHHITLADLVPDNGVIVLSFHYQAGMRASPSRVQIEKEPCGHDLIGFVRLRVAGPVARVNLTWGNK